MTYQIWDSISGNCIGSYPSEHAALGMVASLAHTYGSDAREVAALGLIAESDDGEDSSLIADGDALVHRALSALQPA